MFSDRRMSLFGRAAVAVVAASLLSSTLYAQEKGGATTKPSAATESQSAEAPAIDPKAKAVLDRYLEVTGGRAAYEKVKSRLTRANIEIVGQGINGTVVTSEIDPDKMLTVTDITGIGVIEQGLNGTTAWTRSPMEGARLLEGKEFEQLKFQAQGDTAALEPEKIFKSVQLAGDADVDGKPATQIDLDGPTGKVSQFYDKASGLLVKMNMTIVSPQGEIPVSTSISDYKDVAGVKYPHATVTNLGPMQIKTTFTEIKVNPELPADAFKLPEEIQKLLADKK